MLTSRNPNKIASEAGIITDLFTSRTNVKFCNLLLRNVGRMPLENEKSGERERIEMLSNRRNIAVPDPDKRTANDPPRE